MSLATALVAVLALAGAIALMTVQQRHEDAAVARDQRFVDTASQFVVNMFSYTQDTIDASVDRFVDSTSGPLRDMMSQGQNTENLKLLFRDTNASAEAVINGAALEKVDEIGKNAAVLVAVRVTVTDVDGNNAPSRPYRLRVVVHEDDNGHHERSTTSSTPTGGTDELPSRQAVGRIVDSDGRRVRRTGRRRRLALLEPGGDQRRTGRRATSWRRWPRNRFPRCSATTTRRSNAASTRSIRS